MDDLTVMVLVAGRGTRLSPLTDYRHKATLSVCGKSILQRILKNLEPIYSRYKTRFVFLVNHASEDFTAHAARVVLPNYPITFVQISDINNQALAVLEAQNFIRGHLLLYYGDTIIQDSMKYFIPMGDTAFIAKTNDVSRWCSVQTDQTGLITDIAEKPKEGGAGNFVVGGYWFEDGQQFSPRPVQEKYLSEAVSWHLAIGHEMHTYVVKNYICIDTPEDLETARKMFGCAS